MIEPVNPGRDIASEVKAEQIRLVHHHLPTLMLSNFLVMFIVWLVLYGAVNTVFLIVWTAALSVLVTVRLVLFRIFQRRKNDILSVLPWGRYATVLALVSGILWGFLAPLSINTEAIRFFAVNGILVVMVSIALAPGSSYRPSYLVFAVPVMISVSLATLYRGDQYNYLLGMIGLVSLGVIIFVSRNIEQALIDSIKIRFEKQSLLNELQIQKQEADRANLAKSKFLAAASHDLRQPLHALGLYLDTMNTQLNTERQRELAEKMSLAVNALNDLFQRLLDISKLDAGIVEPNIGDFSIGELFNRLEVRFLPLAKAKELDIVFHRNEEILLSDPLLLEIVLDNLISNAIRYTDTGVVSVSSAVGEEGVVIDVSDTGCGIPKEEQKNIFAEFYQLHNPERDRTKGLGLGLSIVNRLCQLLGHRLHLDSEVKRGTTFRLLVPAGNAENIRTQAVVTPHSGWDLTGARVLVIDDEAEVREAMGQLLANWGCRSTCVDSIEEAKAALRNGVVPDLIIADYRLRDSQTGVDAIRTLLGMLRKPVPGILITGDTAPERLQEAARSGFKLLHKPVNAGQLRMVVNHLLAHNRT